MSKTTLFLTLLLGGWFLIVSNTKDPNNPPLVRTGAPGETTCGATGCHSGGTYTGNITITGIPDTIQLNTEYTVTLTHKSNAKRAGFELTCLDNSNAKYGTLTAGTGTSIGNQSSNGRQYVRQATPKTLSTVDSTASWSFVWKSPATAPAGNTAKFYFASLASNANNNKSGDNPLVGFKQFYYATAVSATGDLAETAGIKMYPTVVTDALRIEMANASEAQVTVFALNGRQILRTQINGGAGTLPLQYLTPGVYLVQVEIDGKTTTKRVLKQ